MYYYFKLLAVTKARLMRQIIILPSQTARWHLIRSSIIPKILLENFGSVSFNRIRYETVRI